MKPRLLFLPFVLCLLLNVVGAVNGQTITTYAGYGCFGPDSGDGVPATNACIGYPASGSFDSLGNYYFGEDFGSARVEKINIAGVIRTVAGNGIAGFSGDGGPATAASIRYPAAIVDAAGNIFIADRDNHRVRKVYAATGIINTIAGNGLGGHSGDGGPATAATLWPCWVCADVYGNVYVNDSSCWIRKISPTGVISTVAGNGILGASGDGGPATAAALGGTSICTDISGNIYIGGSGIIRKIDVATGIIATIAGNGIATPYLGDGMPATDAQFSAYAIAVDLWGNIFIADYGLGNSRVLKIDGAGIIHTVAGTGTDGFSGDTGPGTAAQIYNPEGVAIDGCGNVYIADDANRRIRKVNYPPAITTPAISLSGIVSAPAGATVTVTATVASAGSSYLIHWMNHGMEFTTTTVPSVTYTKPPGIDTITAKIVPTGWGCWDSTTSAGHIVSEDALNVGSSTGLTVRMWPNPATNMLHISSEEKISSVVISNMLGQVVLAKEYNQLRNISLSLGEGRGEAPLPAGVYIVKVNGIYVQKLIKE